MTDESYEIVRKDSVFEVRVQIIERCREVLVGKDFRHTPKTAVQMDVKHAETNVEDVKFSHADKQTAVNRAIRHLGIIGEFE